MLKYRHFIYSLFFIRNTLPLQAKCLRLSSVGTHACHPKEAEVMRVQSSKDSLCYIARKTNTQKTL